MKQTISSQDQQQSHIQPPMPRDGLFLGGLDTFIGPGATWAELYLQFLSSLILGTICWWTGRQRRLQSSDDHTDGIDETSTPIKWQDIIVILLAIDMVGGVVTNSTNAAKRWYHRDGQGFVQHMTFIAIHAIQIAAVSFVLLTKNENDNENDDSDKNRSTLMLSNQWVYFLTVYGTLLVSSIIVLTVPLYLQRPTAMTLVSASIPLSMSPTLVESTPGIEWFIPLLFLKLLVSHLTYETPFRPDSMNDNNNKCD